MTMILASLPKQSQDTAKAYIQQTMRNNVSGEFWNDLQGFDSIDAFDRGKSKKSNLFEKKKVKSQTWLLVVKFLFPEF